MSIEKYYPRNGLWHWLTGQSPTPLGENRWDSKEQAESFAERQEEHASAFGISCHVVNEYSSEYPYYPWRVLCEGRKDL